MARLEIVYWRDIPAQVIARAGRRAARRPLEDRFGAAIDRAAMRAGLSESDAYLGEWRRAPAVECGDDIEAEAEAAAVGLEAAFDDSRLAVLVAAGGRSPD